MSRLSAAVRSGPAAILFLLVSFIGVAQAAPLAISLVEAKVIPDLVTDEPVISFRMTEESAKAFTELTTANVGKTMELRVDGKTVFAPIIREPILGGSGLISGGLEGMDLNDLAVRLLKGSAKIEVEVIDE